MGRIARIGLHRVKGNIRTSQVATGSLTSVYEKSDGIVYQNLFHFISLNELKRHC